MGSNLRYLLKSFLLYLVSLIKIVETYEHVNKLIHSSLCDQYFKNGPKIISLTNLNVSRQRSPLVYFLSDFKKEQDTNFQLAFAQPKNPLSLLKTLSTYIKHK